MFSPEHHETKVLEWLIDKGDWVLSLGLFGIASVAVGAAVFAPTAVKAAILAWLCLP